MQADIDQAMGGFDSRVIPNLSQPEILSSSPADEPEPPPDRGVQGSDRGANGGRGTTKRVPDDLTNAPSWWSENPEKIPEWMVPSGSQYRDFFTPENKENFTGWPKFKHHRHPKVPDMKPLCIKYSTTGSCRAACRLSHVKASSMDAAMREQVNSRFSEVYRKKT